MKKICAIRDICRAIGEFEREFVAQHQITLNEGMILCTLKEKSISSGEIAKEINLTSSNTSKLLRSIESKGYVKRVMGKEDKRQMYFLLTKSGSEKLSLIENDSTPFPSTLEPFFAK